jgi:hypothetical protein
VRKDFPNDIKQEVRKMHFAGKKHSNICKAIRRAHGIEMSEVDVYNVIFLMPVMKDARI